MSYSFDEEYSDENIETISAESISAAVEEMVTPQQLDEQMSEVEKRLEVAHYYRMLLKNELFANPSEAGQTVENEVRTFIRGRLAVLLGLKPEVASSSTSDFSDDEIQSLKEIANKDSEFSNEEVKVLKVIASKLIGKPHLIENKPKPSLRKVQNENKSVAPVKNESSSVKKVQNKVEPKRAAPKVAQKPQAPNKNTPKFGEVGWRFTEGEREYEVQINEKGELYNKDVTPARINPRAIPAATSKAEIEATMQMHALKTQGLGLMNITESKG